MFSSNQQTDCLYQSETMLFRNTCKNYKCEQLADYYQSWLSNPRVQTLTHVSSFGLSMALSDYYQIFYFLSQPNNNHNPNNKTTITVVGLRLSNRWEYHPHPHPPTHTHTNSKLHDRAEIEQNSENKSYQSILGDPKTVFEPYPNPKNSPLGPQKVKNDPKIKSKSNVRI